MNNLDTRVNCFHVDYGDFFESLTYKEVKQEQELGMKIYLVEQYAGCSNLNYLAIACNETDAIENINKAYRERYGQDQITEFDGYAIVTELDIDDRRTWEY